MIYIHLKESEFFNKKQRKNLKKKLNRPVQFITPSELNINW